MGQDTESTEQFRIAREPGQSDLAFEGWLEATVSSKDHDDQTRWSELSVYQTVSGKIVLQSVGRSSQQGEVDLLMTTVLDEFDDNKVVSFFGHRWLAKKLYEDLEIDAAEEI